MATRTKPLISIIVPAYNEAPNLKWLHRNLSSYLKREEINSEIIYINDGSTDSSLKIIKKLSATYKNVRYVSFSRNFGKESATTAGFRESKGDAVIVIDSDGQHPVEMLGTFIAEWKLGWQVVIGVRTANQKEGFVKRVGSQLFYFLQAQLSNNDVVTAATDFRLLDRKVVDTYNELTERNRITRGLIDWLGFRRKYIDFVANERHGGEATYNYGKLMKLAMHAFVSQSTKPLKFVGGLGAIVSAISFIAGAFFFVEMYMMDDVLDLNITGTALLAVFLSFLVGIILTCQGLLSLYIESIYHEAQNRPLYVVDEKSND